MATEQINLAVIAGNLGRDPELTYIGSGEALCKLSVATKMNYQRDGEWKSKTTWHRVVVWGKQAERVSTLKKGDHILVQGSYENDDYEKDGVKHYGMALKAKVVQSCNFAKSGEDQPKPSAQPEPDPSDEDLPF